MGETLRKLKLAMHEKTSGDGGSRIHKIIAHLFASPIVTIVDLQKRHNVRYVTAKRDVENLLAKEILMPLPDQSIKTFFAREIFRIAYIDSQEAGN